MPDDAPLLSILVPTYNRAGYLRGCLASLLATTVDCEILVSDNASTDDTEAVARSFTDPRVRYERQATNVGVVGNHNALLARMRGRYFCLFGDDDEAMPGCFEDKVALLERFEDVAMAFSRVGLIGSDGQPLQGGSVFGQLPYGYVGGRDEFLALLPNCYISWQSLVMRRAVYAEVGPLAEDQWGLKASMDWYWLQRCMRGRKVAFLPEETVRYRIHGGGYSRDAERGGHFQEDRAAIWRKWLLEEPEPPVLDHAAWRRMGEVALADARDLAKTGAATGLDPVAALAALRAAYEARMAARFQAADPGG